MNTPALQYHSSPRPGKLSVEISKPADNAHDLAMAYSPGVAEPVVEISKDVAAAYNYTIKGNLVAVISNGTAILGLGNLGAQASKPVMEGKCLLFKRFANLDAVDIEVDSEDPQEFIDTVARIANTFGGINLEDIKAPECFQIEEELKKRCAIPIFHDDQHGTAIVTVAGMLNALEIQGKTLGEARMVCLGSGAAATACCNLLIASGLKRENLIMLDSKGVIHSQRNNLTPWKQKFAVDTQARTLDEAIEGADVFLGLAGEDLLSESQLQKMAPNPVVFACSNPNPEIKPEVALAARDDLIMATGRSDYPNQVNNVLGFPFIFRGALDVRASTINEEMKLAAVEAIRSLAKEPVPHNVAEAYGVGALTFGKDYIIPKPLDARLLPMVSRAVAEAAVSTGVNQLPLPENYFI
mgnify:FL=1